MCYNISMKKPQNQGENIVHDFFHPKDNTPKKPTTLQWAKRHQTAWNQLHQAKKITLRHYTEEALMKQLLLENKARCQLRLKQNLYVSYKDMVNYIRHNIDDYYQAIRQNRTQDVYDSQYRLYKWYILSLIGQAYPFLHQETLRQKKTLVETSLQYEWMEESMLQFLHQRHELIVNIPPRPEQTPGLQNPIDMQPQNLNQEHDYPQMDPGHSP